MDDAAFSEVLAEAIRARGLGLERLAVHVRERGLPCSASTLSLWQNGRTRPRRADSLRVVAVLEDLLGLEPGHLLAAAGRPEPGDPRWWDAVVDPRQVFTGGELIARLRTEWGVPEVLPFQREYLQETLYVRGRERVRLEVVQLLRAVEPGRHRMLAVYYQTAEDGRPDPCAWRPEVLSGGRVSRRAEFSERGLSVAAIRLDAVTAGGDLTELRYVVEPTGPQAEAQLEWSDHTLSPLSPVRRVSLAVVFLDDPPCRVESSQVRVVDGAVHPLRWRTLDPDVPADVSAVGVLGGGVSIRWSWEQG